MRPWILSLMFFAGGVAFPSAASAHLGSVKFIDVRPGAEAVHLQVDIEAVDAAMELGLSTDASDEAIRIRREALNAWVAQGRQIREGEAACPLTVGSMVFVERDARRYVRFEAEAACAGEGQRVLRDDLVYPDDPQHEALVTLRDGSGEGAVVLRRGHRETDIEPAGVGALIAVFAWQGVLHFALGFDHVLFLLSLLLGVGLGALGGGKGTARTLLRQLAWVVTAFTVGHSVTLIFAALEIVVAPAAPVEIAIAASIAFVALWNVRRLRTGKAKGLSTAALGEKADSTRQLAWTALLFGLIHGFGFSSVLAELGLPALGTTAALLAFNVGIEVAQLAFVALCIGPLLWLGRRGWYSRTAMVGSVAIAACAAYWVVERIQSLGA